MIIILCLDNNNGMMFNDRRQSQDRGLREYIAEMTKGEKVYMNAYTEKLYEEINDPSAFDSTVSTFDRSKFIVIGFSLMLKNFCIGRAARRIGTYSDPHSIPKLQNGVDLVFSLGCLTSSNIWPRHSRADGFMNSL